MSLDRRVFDDCSFETERLRVAEWHEAESQQGCDLVGEVTGIMTAATTAQLPPDWQGDYDAERATGWIAERDEESTTLMVVDRLADTAVGLVFMYEEPAGAGTDARLGYVLAEAAWGRGLASELVAGLVGWCRAQGSVRSLAGGVALDNLASARVLEKNGFVAGPVEVSGEQVFMLIFEQYESI